MPRAAQLSPEPHRPGQTPGKQRQGVRGVGHHRVHTHGDERGEREERATAGDGVDGTGHRRGRGGDQEA